MTTHGGWKRGSKKDGSFQTDEAFIHFQPCVYQYFSPYAQTLKFRPSFVSFHFLRNDHSSFYIVESRGLANILWSHMGRCSSWLIINLFIGFQEVCKKHHSFFVFNELHSDKNKTEVEHVWKCQHFIFLVILLFCFKGMSLFLVVFRTTY